jgi:hypothetical protein
MASDFSSPVKVSLLEASEMEMLQAFLNIMGYNPGPIDGLWGPAHELHGVRLPVRTDSNLSE